MDSWEQTQRKKIEKNGWTILPSKSEPSKSDFTYTGKCKFCKKDFTCELNNKDISVMCYEQIPEVCNAIKCQDKLNITVRKCKLCDRDYNYDERNTKTDPFCSDKCQEEHTEKERIYYEKARLEMADRQLPYSLPPKYIDLDTDKDLSKLYNKSLYIFGPPGSGKSVLMASLLKKYVRENILTGDRVVTDKDYLKPVAHWLSITQFIMKLQSLYHTSGGDPFYYAQDIAKYKGILCIDDLGSCKNTEYVQQIIYYILNYREEFQLPMIITSNYPLAKIDDLVGERISSRIAGMCEIVELKGEDKRLLDINKSFELKHGEVSREDKIKYGFH